MIDKANKLIEILRTYSVEEIKSHFVYSDSIQYEFEKLYEDSTRLSAELRINHPELHIDELRGIRNRVAHNYEVVSLNILLDTIKNDIPTLKSALEDFVNSYKK